MKRILYILPLLLTLLLTPGGAQAQQVKFSHYRDMRNYLKNSKKTDAENLIKKLTPADSIEKPYLQGMLNQYLFEQQNIKLYYGEKVDTASVFKTLYSMFESFETSYPKVKNTDQYYKPMQMALQTHQNNLRIGGNYFITRKDYKEAYKFYSIFLRMDENKVITPNDSVLGSVFNNAIIIASNLQMFGDVVNLAEKAHATNHDSETIDLQLCDALRKMQREDEWVSAVKDAMQHHPQQFAFYGMLIDYYLKGNHAEEARKLAEDLIQNDSTNYVNCFVKGYVCQQTQDIDTALKWLHKSHEIKSDYPPVLTNLGFCTVRKAEQTENSIDHFPFSAEEKAQIQAIYREAESYLEESRKLDPKDQQHWAPLLWKCYYKLNEGEKLDEIEKLM